MAIQSPEELLSTIEKSDLLDAEQLAAARQSVQGLDDATVAARKLARDGHLTRWQAAQLLAGRSSFLLGKYKLIDLLGRGGMGRVFLGRHVTMQRPVALKIVSRDVGNNPAALERFLAEARAIAALDHPAIVQAYSVDCEGERYYIVMEYVDGRDLQRVVEEDGPLDCRTAVDYMRQAADGLAHAHGRNLVHCDIKPSNLLVNSQGQVKILDMGMARLGGGDDEDDVSDSNHILGSVDYLAPEQALGSGNFDHRADIYSLGCTLYFLLTGHPPFPEGTLPERILKHQTQQPRPIPTERPDVPPQLVQVCRRMMAKQPEDRFQSADEVIAALAELPAVDREAAPAGAAAVARPGPDAGLEDELADADQHADSVAAAPDAMDWARQALATTAGRLVLGGVVLLILLLAVGVSIAIVAATSPPPGPEMRGETAVAVPDEPLTHGEEEEEEEELSDLAQAFAARVKAAQEAAAKKERGEEEDPSDNDESKPSEPEQPAAEQPPAEQPPAGDQPADKPDDSKPQPPAEPAKPDSEKPAASDSKPEKDPPPKPDTPPKKEKPPTFRDFPETVDLPPPAVVDGQPAPAEPISLGKLHVREKAPWIVVLSGGEVFVPNAEITISRGTVEGASRAYIVQLTKADESTPIARLWFEPKDQQLKFQWLEAATETQDAGLLRLCRINLTIDGEARTLALSKPAAAPPLEFDLDKKIDRVTIELGDLPDDKLLRLEITKIDGAVQQYQTQPSGPVEVKKPLTLAFQRMDRDRNAKPIAVIHVSFTTSRKGLTVMRRIEYPPRRMVPPGTQLSELRKQGEAEFKKVMAQVKKADGHAARDKFRPVLDKIEEGLGHLDLIEKIDKQATIHYRILLQSGNHQLPLFDSQQ
ncbi:MAG: protein kinase [Thermoguttaceae bacterium]|jgi:serine/threonine-protein kinase|nr:protein kinase [Thermoguttaceae bacterium]